MGKRSREHREAVEDGTEKPFRTEKVKRPWHYRIPFRTSGKKQKEVDKAVKEIMKKKKKEATNQKGGKDVL
ncbi:MAG: hypothetical protein KAR06_04845 [Deltaproteobacteria bacterium]|nr:hypothetical protein [Deltaproteobacteria bacterium]